MHPTHPFGQSSSLSGLKLVPLKWRPLVSPGYRELKPLAGY